MSWATWLTVVGICTLGAMSPGPSLAVIVRQTLSGGRANGVIAAVAHGLGFGFYALLCISGLAFIITTSPNLFQVFQMAGAAYLMWLGVRNLASRASASEELPGTAAGSAARDGFLIVFLNPKIAVFLIALFSQVIGPQTPWFARWVYVGTGWIIDTFWYVLVAWLFSSPLWFEKIQSKSVWFDRVFGVILFALGARLFLLNLGQG